MCDTVFFTVSFQYEGTVPTYFHEFFLAALGKKVERKKIRVFFIDPIVAT